ncbi:MAG: cation diffusion facilitator family transporter [Desulfobulbaceae bacterium]|nr:cation diffusion facilitator family transporter [Desulfobulbaceae bacterium]
MASEHTHNHNHNHNHSDHGSRRSLFLSFIIISSFMVIEAIGGLLTNSLALLSDAGHMLTDAGALALSLLAIKIGEKPPSLTKTFGYRRFEILAALFNGMALWAIVGVILREAYLRLQSPPDVKAAGMMAVAVIGLLVNLVAIRLLHAHKDESINVRGAFLHVIADSLGSVGVLVAGIIIMTTGWTLIDPLISLVICALILWSSWRIIRDAVHILLLGVPTHINYREVEENILDHEGVCCLYDLHIWSIASGHEAVSAHVVIAEGFGRQEELLKNIIESLHSKFGIDHTTIQIEESHTIKDQGINAVCRIDGQGRACAIPADNE